MLVPRYRMSPDVGRYSPRMSRPNVVLPDPVSPTSASVSPRLMASEIPSTALRVGRRRPGPPWPVAKYLVTSMVSMIGTSSAMPGAGGPPTGLAARTAGSVGHLVPQRETPGVRAAVDLQHGAGDVARLRRGE